MTDELILRREPRETHPAGQYPAMCLDLIDLGMRVSDFQGRESAAHSCVFVFATGERTSKGMDFTIPYECNVTFGERSKLLKFLNQWRGKPFEPAELNSGFKLSALVGKTALVSLTTKVSKTGNEYTVIDTIMPLPKGMPPPVIGEYKRAPFWAEKKIEYKLAYDQFMARVMREQAQAQGKPPPDEPLSGGPSDEVPF